VSLGAFTSPIPCLIRRKMNSADLCVICISRDSCNTEIPFLEAHAFQNAKMQTLKGNRVSTKIVPVRTVKNFLHARQRHR
jgi:hypothetical protein